MNKKLILTVTIFIFSLSAVRGKIDIDSSSLNILEKGRVTEFIDNVVITGPNYRVNSDKAVSKKADNIIEASGSVRINYSSDTVKLEGWCNKVIIDQEKKKIELRGEVKTVFIPLDIEKSTPVTVLSDSADVYYGQNKSAEFYGSVYTEYETTRIKSQKAIYSDNSKLIEFSGSPRAVSEGEKFNSVYTGERIIYDTKKEMLSIKGDAHTRITFDESEL